jgi:hypothetical protein
MTRTKEQIIETLVQRTGKSAEYLKTLTKYHLCSLLEESREESSESDKDLGNVIGSSIKRKQLVK